MNTGNQRDGEKAPRRPRNQQGYRLKGMSHDVLGLGIVLRLLVELFDARHLLAFLGRLDPIGQAHDAPRHAHRCEQLQRQRTPQPREHFQIESVRMKQMQQTTVDLGAQPHRAHKAGNTGQV